MNDIKTNKKRRGRPPKQAHGYADTRVALIRAGLDVMTEKGFSASGLDEILKSVGVPKGSFYHYFQSKEEFGSVLIDTYSAGFAAKIDRFLLDDEFAQTDRFRNLVDNLRQNMIKHDFSRGCLVGNLGQEMGALPLAYRQQLIDVFEDWQRRTSDCLQKAQQHNEIATDINCSELSRFFWIGWEGAVLRAKLERSASSLNSFSTLFFQMLDEK